MLLTVIAYHRLTQRQYGNEPSLGIEYSNAALLIDIPQTHKRKKTGWLDHAEYSAAVDDFKYAGTDDEGERVGDGEEDNSDHRGDEQGEGTP